MNEHSFIRAVHARLPPEVFRWKIHDTFAGGVPDAFYAGPASTLFVEYKYVKALPKRDTSPIRTSLTTQQIHWLNRLHDFNQPVAVVVGCEDQATVLLDKTWNSEILRKDFLQQGVAIPEVARWIESTCSKGLRLGNGKAVRTDCGYELASNLEHEEV